MPINALPAGERTCLSSSCLPPGGPWKEPRNQGGPGAAGRLHRQLQAHATMPRASAARSGTSRLLVTRSHRAEPQKSMRAAIHQCLSTLEISILRV
ncbi:hypothetical protein BS78_10G144000 [Paspalum vaginatum]|nr:hypothetical protein BS78_10G144000 [Paspalum vaginatum]